MADFSLPTLQEGKNDKETMQNLFDTVLRLRRELEFVLQNIGTDNAPQIGEKFENTVSKDGIISSINQTSEEIGIQADKIRLEGLVTANNHFKILEDGSIETNKIAVQDNSNNLIITPSGLRMKYIFVSTGYWGGWEYGGIVPSWEGVFAEDIPIFVYTPAAFVIDKAILHTKSMPVYLKDEPVGDDYGSGAPDGYYHGKGLELRKLINSNAIYYNSKDGEVSEKPTFGSTTNITSETWGSVWNPTGSTIQIKSADIKDYINIGGRSIFIVKSSLPATWPNSRYRGFYQMELEIEGYLKG